MSELDAIRDQFEHELLELLRVLAPPTPELREMLERLKELEKEATELLNDK